MFVEKTMLLARSARTGLDVARRAAAKARPTVGVSTTQARTLSSAPGLECGLLFFTCPSALSLFMSLSFSSSHSLLIVAHALPPPFTITFIARESEDDRVTEWTPLPRRGIASQDSIVNFLPQN